MSQTAYDVWKVQYRLGLQDPNFNYTRYHTVIFVQTNANGSGRIHHVTGDLVNGMRYENKAGDPPQESETFHARQYLGKVLAANHPAAVDTLLGFLQAPPKQIKFNTATMTYVRCKTDGSLYGPGETVPPLMKSTEWTEQKAILALSQHHLIQTGTSQQSQSQQTATAQAHAQQGYSQQGQVQQQVSPHQQQTSQAGGTWVFDPQRRGYRCGDGRQWIWWS